MNFARVGHSRIAHADRIRRIRTRIFFAPVFALGAAICAPFSSSTAVADPAAHFSGGLCVSQGDWVQSALEQSNAVVNAINTLREDPNCTNLVKTLDEAPKFSSTNEGAGDDDSMSSVFQELQSIREYLGSPKIPTHGSVPAEFKSIVTSLLLEKSYNNIKNARLADQLAGLSEEQKKNVELVSQRIKNFLSRSQRVSTVAVSTAKTLMSALPQNKLCFTNRPNQAALIFSSIVNSAAALASGGQVTQVGELVSTLVQFNREMAFANILSGVELARYRASMSCLVESTQEAYCALQDAQDSLNFNRGFTESNNQLMKIDKASAPLDSMYGLMILLRDVPIITSWMQKILFGIDPKLQIEATMKNLAWDSIINFIKTRNSLPAVYRDKRQVYYESTSGQGNQNKLAMIKDMIDGLIWELTGGPHPNAGSYINFFTNAFNVDSMPFILLGAETPKDFNSQMNPFHNIFLAWSRDGSHGLDDPDKVVEAIGVHLQEIIEKASVLSSRYFSARMIVDSQNLIVEGMNGPNVSPYRALFEVDHYIDKLVAKLTDGLSNPRIAPDQTKTDAYRAMIPLVRDLQVRIRKITEAMRDISNAQLNDPNTKDNETLARKEMDIIYEVANMLNSRDSFIANRIANAVRMDVSDTLWRNDSLNERQENALKVYGRDLLTRLSNYFNNDPILQRLDVAQAAPIHKQNLAAVEQLFAYQYWQQLNEINCALNGHFACSDIESPPTQSFMEGYIQQLTDFFTFAPVRRTFALFRAPVDDSANTYNLRAKLCAQTLGFTSYADRFQHLCEGAVLQSEYSDGERLKNLNFVYDDEYKAMVDLRDQAQSPAHIESAKVYGTCALRSYIRKNLIYRMYTEL